MNKNYTLLFINGLYRSGTAFLSRLIDAFPSTYIYEDGFRFPYYYLLDSEKSIIFPRDMQKKKELHLDRPPQNFLIFIENLQTEIRNMPLNVDLREKLLESVNIPQGGKTFLEIAEAIFDKTQEFSKASVVGTKTTHQHNYINDMLKFFPYAKWIEITRDPRAIYCSAKASHTADLKFICEIWNDAIEAYQNIDNKYKDRFLLVKYEDLILYPENAVSSIQKFLDLSFEPKFFLTNLVLKRNDNSSWFSNSSYKSDGIFWGDVGVKTAEYFDKRPVFRWRSILNRLEKCIILNRCKANMEKMGFLENNENRSLSVRDIYDTFEWFFEISTWRFLLKEIVGSLVKK